jgi:membrane complex biogenesis BtpA family protein
VRPGNRCAAMIPRIALDTIFGIPAPVVGMVHLPPLPGAPLHAESMHNIVARACDEARRLEDAGFAGVLVENYGDAPFHPDRVPPETVAALTRAVTAVTAAVRVPAGVNVLRNDAAAALAIATVTGAAFIRVNVHTGALLTDQGWIEGRAHETLRERARLGARVAILADVLVKHASPPPGLDVRSAARDTWHRGLADALIVTGPATGTTADPARVRAVREAVPGAPVWIGSGLTTANARDLLPLANGAIVGSSLRTGGGAGQPLDDGQLRAWADLLRRDRT